MLIKKSIVEKWYQTDSWVYKNFSYLFQNPLWKKRVPRGFSVCPYFWLSLFSILFRFCFVAPIQYIFTPLTKLIGKPATVVDTFCKKILVKIGFDEDKLGSELFVGFNIFLVVVILACVACCGISIAFVGVKLVVLYAFLKDISLGIFAYWSGLSFITMWTILFIHKTMTNTECRTMNYLWVLVVLFFIASGVFIPTELIHGIVVLFTSIAAVVVTAGGIIWNGICLIGWGIGIGAVWLAKIVWTGVWWKPLAVLFLPWWGFIAILGVVGWLFDKLCTRIEKRNTETLLQTDPMELYSRYRSAWVGLFQRILTLNDHWGKGEVFEKYDSYTARACKVLSYELFRETFEVMYKTKLDKLQMTYPGISSDPWKVLKKYNGTAERFANLAAVVNGGFKEDGVDFSASVFELTLDEIIKSPRFRGQIESLEKEFIKADKEKEKRRENRHTSWSHLTCLKVTSAIGEGACSVGRGLLKCGKLIRSAACQIRTLCAYLWMLTKAKKQGVCPYFVFTDANNK